MRRPSRSPVRGPRWGRPGRHGALAAPLAAGLLAAGCAGNLRWPNIRTQRYPSPMEAQVVPLPPGTEARFLPGPEEVLVIRHADPVQLRPAGQLSAFPMSFIEKSRRVNAGSWIYTLPGGRAEVLWPEGSTVVLFGRSACVVGSQSRGEPALFFFEVERADLIFVERDQVELLGGSVLTLESGPFVVERTDAETLRVRNQSKRAGFLAFREAEFRIDPGEVIELPLLEAGGRPAPDPPGARAVAGPGFQVRVHGAVEVLEDPGGVSLRADGEHLIAGLGVKMELLEGESVRFVGLRVPPPPRVAQPEPAPEPEPELAPEVVPELVPEVGPSPEPGPQEPPLDEEPEAGELPPPIGPPAGSLPGPQPGAGQALPPTPERAEAEEPGPEAPPPPEQQGPPAPPPETPDPDPSRQPPLPSREP